MVDNSKFRFSVKGMKRFISHDIWRFKPDPKDNKIKYFLLKTLKVMILSFEGFVKDNVQVRSSSLTYFSLLSIVPVLAMAFGIAKGFDLEKQLEDKLIENFSGQTEVLDQSIKFANNLLANTQGGLVAGIGFLVLIYSVIRLFTNIEQSFNTIWEVKKERSLVRKLTDYLAIVILAPVFLVGASGLTVQIAAFLESLTSSIELLGVLDRIFLPLLRLLPFTIIWILFMLMYMIMPNTKVRLSSALIAAIIAGTAFQLTQWALINFQVGVSRNNAIYGSFAALPLFLIWLQVSWLIFLFGAEIAFSHQNIGNYERDVREKDLSVNAKLEAYFVVVAFVVQRFVANKHAMNFEEISRELKLPVKICHELLQELAEAEVLTITEDEDGEIAAYQPATDPSKISFAFVLEKLHSKGMPSVWEDENFKFEDVRTRLNIIGQEIHNSSGALLLKDIRLS